MIVAFVQLLFALAAGVALFGLWRAAAPAEPRARAIVAAGFLVRAVAGQVLFWISWAGLPIAPSLQRGNGLWFFAVDATYYMEQAAAALAGGPEAILFVPRGGASPFYVQSLATAFGLLGTVASTAVLLNLFAFAGTLALIRKASETGERARWYGSIVAAALSVYPAGLLWSLQPLKDTMFQFLVVTFVFSAWLWERSALRGRALAALLMLASLYAIAGVRWYVAMAMIGASIFFFVVACIRSRPRIPLAIASVAVIVLMSQAMLAGAGPYVPETIRAVLRPSTSLWAIAALPRWLPTKVERSREGFESAGGDTLIRVPGETETAKTPEPVPAAPSTAVVHAVPRPAPGVSVPPLWEKRITVVLHRTVDAWNRGDAASFMDQFARDPNVLWKGRRGEARGWDNIATALSARLVTARPGVPLSTSRAVIVAAKPGEATVEVEWTAATGREQDNRSFRITFREFEGRLRIVEMEALDAARMAPAPPPKPVPAPPPPPPPVEPAKENHVLRLLVGAAAAFLPQTLGQALGLFELGGGRGLLWFTDVDTLFLDAVLAMAIVVLVRNARAAVRTPLVWFVVVATAILTVPMIYSVANFGTLFRLRGIIYLALALVPLAVAARGDGASLDSRRTQPTE